MRVYLASWFSSKNEMKDRAKQLQENGIEVTSSWVNEKISGKTKISDVSINYLRETGRIDIEDLIQANVVVLNTPSVSDFETEDIPLASWARGGRHFEAGFHYAMMVFFTQIKASLPNEDERYLILIGHRENVFHYLDGIKSSTAAGFYLPPILCFDTWQLAKDHLVYNKDRKEHLMREHVSK